MLTNEDCARLAVYGCEDCNLALDAYLEILQENKRLQAERDWLASVLAEQARDTAVDSNSYDEEFFQEYWIKEATRHAMEDGE